MDEEKAPEPAKSKRGPPTKYTPAIRETFVRLSKEGKTLVEIAEVVNVTTRTLSNWLNEHEDLFLAVREARQSADELVEFSLYRRAIGYTHPEEKAFQYEGSVITHETLKHYPPDTAAAQFWLANRQPERWKNKSALEHSGPNGKPIETRDVSADDDAALEARAAELVAKREAAKAAKPDAPHGDEP